jgi:hypothetical protein
MEVFWKLIYSDCLNKRKIKEVLVLRFQFTPTSLLSASNQILRRPRMETRAVYWRLCAFISSPIITPVIITTSQLADCAKSYLL